MLRTMPLPQERHAPHDAFCLNSVTSRGTQPIKTENPALHVQAGLPYYLSFHSDAGMKKLLYVFCPFA